MDMDMDMVDMDMDMDMERSTMYCTRVQHVKQEPTSMVHVHVKEPDGAQHTYWCKPASRRQVTRHVLCPVRGLFFTSGHSRNHELSTKTTMCRLQSTQYKGPECQSSESGPRFSQL